MQTFAEKVKEIPISFSDQIKKPFLKASEIIRQSKDPKCVGHFSDGNGAFCVQGTIMHYLGWDGKDEWSVWHSKPYNEMMELLNNDEKLRQKLAVKNNGMFGNKEESFAEIADWLES